MDERILFARHGAPLVLKADNGSAYTAQPTRDFLDHHRVVLLLSPPYYPQYNGACEAGNGTIKRLTHDIAVRHDRPHAWSLDDVEAGRLLANRRITDRTQVHTPEQRFADRLPIPADDRIRLRDAIAAATQRRLAEHDVASEDQLPKITIDALHRQAITDALTGLGIITIRCRPIRLCNPQREVG